MFCMYSSLCHSWKFTYVVHSCLCFLVQSLIVLWTNTTMILNYAALRDKSYLHCKCSLIHLPRIQIKKWIQDFFFPCFRFGSFNNKSENHSSETSSTIKRKPTVMGLDLATIPKTSPSKRSCKVKPHAKPPAKKDVDRCDMYLCIFQICHLWWTVLSVATL